ncbi:hypothetical protein BGZ65_006025, partial [Modicella reniformis]
DERVRVERLMKEMCVCSYEPTDLPTSPFEDSFDDSFDEPLESITHRMDSMVTIPPLTITLSRREWKLAAQYSNWLYRWGIVLNTKLDPAHQDDDA